MQQLITEQGCQKTVLVNTLETQCSGVVACFLSEFFSKLQNLKIKLLRTHIYSKICRCMSKHCNFFPYPTSVTHNAAGKNLKCAPVCW